MPFQLTSVQLQPAHSLVSQLQQLKTHLPFAKRFTLNDMFQVKCGRYLIAVTCVFHNVKYRHFGLAVSLGNDIQQSTNSHMAPLIFIQKNYITHTY